MQIVLPSGGLLVTDHKQTITTDGRWVYIRGKGGNSQKRIHVAGVLMTEPGPSSWR